MNKSYFDIILLFYTSKHYSSLQIRWPDVAFLPPGSEKRSCDGHMTYLYFIDHVVCDVLFVPVYWKSDGQASYSRLISLIFISAHA